MARVVSINISNGGVPKHPVPDAEVRASGIIGDRQNDTLHHGGPDRAVSIFSIELIDRLRAEGHPIAPGTAGENLTIEGLDWSTVAPGCRLEFEGGVVLEIASYCSPCTTIRESFAGEQFGRINQKTHPGESRVYARVITQGAIRTNEICRIAV